MVKKYYKVTIQIKALENRRKSLKNTENFCNIKKCKKKASKHSNIKH